MTKLNTLAKLDLTPEPLYPQYQRHIIKTIVVAFGIPASQLAKPQPKFSALFVTSLISAARAVFNRVQVALYGAPLKAKLPDALTARTDVVPLDFEGSPIEIREDVRIAVYAAHTLEHIRFTVPQLTLEYLATQSCSVVLS